VALFALSHLYASGRSENRENSDFKRKDELKLLSKAEKKWNSQNITSYKADIIYMRATFPPEGIEIIVEDENLISAWKTGETAESSYSEDFLKSLTVKKMFDRMRGSLESDKHSPMVLKAVYDKKLGYIKSLSRVPSDEAAAKGRAPFDAGYSIKITALEIIKKE
jgi:hypothetical protein